MTTVEHTAVIRPENQPWWPLPLAEGAHIKVLKTDPDNHRVVFLFRFEPGCVLPEHYHHAKAVAYTVAGEWEYEEGRFQAGDVAYEHVGNRHTPHSENGAELLIIFDGDGPGMIDSYLPDGRTISLDIEAFRLLEQGNIPAVLQRLQLA
ncbi:cupin domain-containing protein [Marinobacter sp. F4216]|uniref:cupin domain-containing protein n=1 Tax=Marinobacter sp. F4216 TaxID=2874281 RepID=UPI001CC031DD|nr:cupin domain-containing protein [Marinobacter sp. F4216]MBZ2169444.1 cupin domain-containing protein [Marinobacter sp. F4216]